MYCIVTVQMVIKTNKLFFAAFQAFCTVHHSSGAQEQKEHDGSVEHKIHQSSCLQEIWREIKPYDSVS